MSQRETIPIVVRGWDRDFGMRLDAFIAELQRLLESVPDEFRHTARIDFETAWSDDARGSIEIFYTRPMTDEELREREQEEETCRRQQYEHAKRVYERAAADVIRFAPPAKTEGEGE